jgi:flagellum-specific peptidoglycan hydrolase FlgJ
MFNHTGDELLSELGFGVGDKLDLETNPKKPQAYPEFKIEFINTVYNAARGLGYTSYYSLLMATQAAKESAWGARAGGNIFGIQWSDRFTNYKPITITTHEVIDGVREKREEQFVDLTGYSIKDNIKFYDSLIEKRFSDVKKFADQGDLKNAVKSFKHVDEGGNRTAYFTEADGSLTPDQYATDPDYVETLTDTIRSAQLRIGLIK